MPRDYSSQARDLKIRLIQDKLKGQFVSADMRGKLERMLAELRGEAALPAAVRNTEHTLVGSPEKAGAPEQVLRSQIGPPISEDDGDRVVFSDECQAYEWVKQNFSRIRSLRMYCFKDGSLSAEFTLIPVPTPATVLFQQDIIRDPKILQQRIDDLYRKLANPITYSVSAAERSVLIRKLQELVAERTSLSSEECPLPKHEHVCSTCDRSFGHDAEEECPEIHGKYYCEACYPTALEHTHYCPLCAEKWPHYSAPDCEESEVAQCPRHTADSSPTSKGLLGVAGMVELKNLLYEQVIAPLRDPARFERYGLTIPNGILMFGPPGCGKTYIARKLAEELGYFFSEVSAGEIGDTFIHGTAMKIATVFNEAEEKAPALLLLDEFEALAPNRSNLAGHQDYRVEEVGEFLRQLESAGSRRILVIAATNEPWKIDSAIQRAGRLDKKLLVSAPDVDARADMLRFHLERRFREANIDLPALARQLEGYSASDLKLLVDEAARKAMRENRPISPGDLLHVRRAVPASISKELKKRYEEFQQRGA
jgi:transitional endoplasmic reticulum ATPase